MPLACKLSYHLANLKVQCSKLKLQSQQILKFKLQSSNFKESLFGCKVFLIFGTLNLMIGPFRPPLLNELKH